MAYMLSPACHPMPAWIKVQTDFMCTHHHVGLIKMCGLFAHFSRCHSCKHTAHLLISCSNIDSRSKATLQILHASRNKQQAACATQLS